MRNKLTDAEQEGLTKWLVPESKLRVFYAEGNPNNKTLEVRGVVDDHVVYRIWSKRQQTWLYHLNSRYMFELWLIDGRLSKDR